MPGNHGARAGGNAFSLRPDCSWIGDAQRPAASGAALRSRAVRSSLATNNWHAVRVLSVHRILTSLPQCPEGYPHECYRKPTPQIVFTRFRLPSGSTGLVPRRADQSGPGGRCGPASARVAAVAERGCLRTGKQRPGSVCRVASVLRAPCWRRHFVADCHRDDDARISIWDKTG